MISRRSWAKATAGLAFATAFGSAGSAPGQFVPADRAPNRRGALRIAKLKHAGDWDVTPTAVPNLANALCDRFQFDVAIGQYVLFPRDPNLVHFPLIYMQGDASFLVAEDDLLPLRRHLDPGGGTLFADATRGSEAFDAAFRRFVAALRPGCPLVPIPRRDPLFNLKPGYDLSEVKRTPGAGGRVGPPELEGVQVDGRWAVIYSKHDIGTGLQREPGPDSRGYDHESSLRIALNVFLYMMLPAQGPGPAEKEKK